MNKAIFKYKLRNKKYTECVDILRKEIIDVLEKRIQQNDNFFSYTTTMDLYNKSQKFLNKKEIKIAYQLFLLDIMEETEEYLLNEIMIMYQELQEM